MKGPRTGGAAKPASLYVGASTSGKRLPAGPDSFAVRAGDGENLRFGLYDARLINDNRLAGVVIGRLRMTLTRWMRQPAHHRRGRMQDGR